MPEGPRLRRLRPADLTAEQREVYDAITGGARAGQAVPLTDGDGSLQGPFDPLLHVPEVGNAVQRLGERLRFSGVLDARTRELAILSVAAHWRSEYEWYAHTTIARERDLLAAPEVDALQAGVVPETCDETERAALLLVQALLRSGEVPEDAYRAAQDLLGTEALVELSCLVGYYGLLAGVLATFAVKTRDDAG